MKNTGALLAVLVAVVLASAMLVGCSSTQSNLTGDGLHATVPSVTGMSLKNATEKIHDSGYEVGSVVPAGSKSTAVVGVQHPAAGTALPRGGEISLDCQ